MIQLPAVARSGEISEGAAGGLVGAQSRAGSPGAADSCVAAPPTGAARHGRVQGSACPLAACAGGTSVTSMTHLFDTDGEPGRILSGPCWDGGWGEHLLLLIPLDDGLPAELPGCDEVRSARMGVQQVQGWTTVR